MIALRSVSLRSRTTGAALLADITLELEAGDVALVTGRSGSGKTALARMLAGSARPDAGEVHMFGHDVARLRRSSIALLRRRAAFVPQELVLLERETALANAAASLSVAAVPRAEARTRAAAALERFGLAAVAAVPVARLSSGQRRLVCLARAAAAEPALLIADDPTAHLDALGRQAFLDMIAELQGRAGAALVASSDPALLAAATRLGWKMLELGAEAAPAATEESPVTNLVPFPVSARTGSQRNAGGAA